MALPPAFPYRDLIVLTAFSVVLGTLVIQGLTLRPLLRALDLHDEDPVGLELTAARERALRAALASFAGSESPGAELVRQQFKARLAPEPADADRGATSRSAHSEIHRAALQAARQAVLAMRSEDEIGDDAFHRIEEELDWLEMAGGQGSNREAPCPNRCIGVCAKWLILVSSVATAGVSGGRLSPRSEMALGTFFAAVSERTPGPGYEPQLFKGVLR
jgi:hypothetical protein